MKKLNLLMALLFASTVTSMAEVEWEIGVGSNYGGLLGITANYGVTEDIEVYGGLALLGGVVGGRYYFTDNVRFNASYGVQGFAIYDDNDKYDFITGLNAGLDYMWDNGFSLGAVYHVTSNADDVKNDIIVDGYKIDKDYTSNISLSLGYRF